jgi:hypothetical protein
MKFITIFLSLIFLFTSCKSENESLNEPILIGRSEGILALSGLNGIEDLATSIDSSNKLLRIFSPDISTSGFSNIWNYEFVSEDGENIYTIKYELCGDCISIGIDSTNYNEDGSAFISKNWINSDLVLEIAEANGGDSFRKENSDLEISVLLYEGVVNNPFPIWEVTYSSPDKGLILRIKAESGEMYQTIHRMVIPF